jgi:hypothetical protein
MIRGRPSSGSDEGRGDMDLAMVAARTAAVMFGVPGAGGCSPRVSDSSTVSWHPVAPNVAVRGRVVGSGRALETRAPHAVSRLAAWSATTTFRNKISSVYMSAAYTQCV